MTSKTKIIVRYAETDKMGIAHHSNYAIWYEAGRTDYIKTLGMTYTQMEQNGVMMPLINLSCHFGIPAKYEDELIIETSAISISAARITLAYTVRREADGAELGYGTTEHGFVDSSTFRPVNVKKRLPEIYEKIKSSIP